MKKFSATLIGGVAFRSDGEPIRSLPTRTEQALLVYLLYHRRPIPRDVLIGIFYPESDQPQGRKNLRTALTRIKSKIGNVLLVEGEEVSCRPDVVLELDTEQFEALMADVSAETLHANLEQFRGDFMAGFFLRTAPEFEHWQIVMRERLRMVAVQGYERLITQLENSAEFPFALECASRLLAIEPLMEHIHRRKMRLLARTGQAALALRHFEEASALFDQELGITLSEPTQALRSRIATLHLPPPATLPAPRGSFVGRRTALADIRSKLCDPELRLLTLFGPGGMGKTRLATEVGRSIHRDIPGLFLDGIYFVDLTTVDSAESLIRALAQVMSLSFDSQMPPREQLLNVMQNREQLWILDNFEQLTDDPAVISLIAAMLEEAKAVKLLVTSRTHLNLYEEIVYDVEGLAVPGNEEAIDGDAARDSDAVTLFRTVAQRRQRTYSPTADDLGIIAYLCRLLEGSPLAIELAAGLLRSTALTEIYDRVVDSMSSLHTTLHNVPDRQRSLQAVFDYSWHLLSAELQTLLAALSIFPGAFSLDAAAAIADADAPSLDQLVRGSLIELRDAGRFQLHSLLREFSAEQLIDSDSITEKHANYFSETLISRQFPSLSLEDHNWIQAQTPDLLMTWRYYLEQPDLKHLHRLAHPLFIYFNNTGLWHFGITLFETTANRVAIEDETISAMLQVRRATMMINQGQIAHATEIFKNSLAILNKAEETYEALMTMAHLGYAYAELGEMEEAITLIERCEKLIDQIDDPGSTRVMHHILGIVFRMAGKFEKARTHLEMVLKLARESTDAISAGLVLDSIANLLRAMGLYEESLEYLKEARSILDAHPSKYYPAMITVNIADIQMLLGDQDAAFVSLEEAATLARQTVEVRDQAGILARHLDAAVRLAHMKLAAELIVDLWQVAQLYGLTVVMEGVMVNSAEFFLKQQAWETANLFLCYVEQNEQISKVGKQKAQAMREQYADTLPEPQPSLSRDQLIKLGKNELTKFSGKL